MLVYHIPYLAKLSTTAVLCLVSFLYPNLANYNIFFAHSFLVHIFFLFLFLNSFQSFCPKSVSELGVFASLHVLARPINLHRLPFSCQTRFRTGTTASPAFRFLDLFRTPNLHSLAVIIIVILSLHLYILFESQYKKQVPYTYKFIKD